MGLQLQIFFHIRWRLETGAVVENLNGEPTSMRIVRFGVFEANIRTGELRKHGIRIKLAEQPFRVLIALLENPRELLTRDELRQRIWSSHTFVDFEQGLNRSINKVREALGDSAVSPRFIETLPGRGYRFIAPVESAEDAVKPAVETAPPVVVFVPPPKPDLRTRKGLVGKILVVLAIAVAFGATVLRFLTPTSVPVLRWTKLTTDNYVKFPPALTDDTRVYFQAAYGGEDFVAQVPVSGGQAVRLALRPPGTSFVLHDLSPDGQQLLLSSDEKPPARTLYAVQVANGAAHGLGGIQAVSAAYSRDGSWLAYCTDSELWVAAVNGSNRRRLAIAKDSLLSGVSWLPGDQGIRFAKQHPVTFEKTVWQVNTDGTALHEVMAARKIGPLEPAGWTRDKKMFVMTSDGNLWASRRNDSPIQLTTGDPEFLSPVRFRDQNVTYAIGVARLGELERYDQQSKTWMPILEGVSAESAEYSRDGKRIAYVSYPQRALWVRQSDGSQPVQITNAPMSAVLPHWSPDGTKIAFMGLPAPGTTCKCFIADANGGLLHLAASADSGSQSDCVWSPDGKQLAYGMRGGIATGEDIYIRTVDLATGAIRKLPGSENLFAPRWSPDGKMISAIPWRVPSDTFGLMIYDTGAKHWQQYWDRQVDSPVWTADSKALIFESGPQIVRFDVKSRKAQVLSERKSEEVGGYWQFIGFTNDGRPIRTLNRDSRQVYRLELSR